MGHTRSKPTQTADCRLRQKRLPRLRQKRLPTPSEYEAYLAEKEREAKAWVTEAIEQNAVNRVNDKGWTPLLVCTSRLGFNIDIVQELCERGANVNQADEQNGQTPLIMAIRTGLVDVVYELCKRGADVNQEAQRGMSPMHFAAQCLNGKIELIQALWKYGADVNKRDNLGRTPLALAVGTRGDLDMIREFCNYGADADVSHASSDRYVMLVLNGIQNIHMNRRKTIEEKLYVQKKLDALSDCLLLLLSTGCHIGEAERNCMTEPPFRQILASRGVLEYALHLSDYPTSLKRLCKFAVRRLIHKPLKEHVHETGLPQTLQKYVCLEVLD